MTTAYWSQWSHDEIMSMHGVDLDEVDTDLDQDEVDSDLRQNKGCNCSNCMDCLGFSWADFM